MRIWVLHIARLVLLSAFLISCNEEEGASYPPVKLEFLTAEAGADGTLQTLVTDKGERLVVASPGRNYSRMEVAAWWVIMK